MQRLKSPTGQVIILFLALLVLDYFWVNEVIGWFFRALFVESTPFRAVVFFLCYLLMLLSVAVLLLSRASFLWFGLTLIFMCGSRVYSKINGEPFGLLDIETALKYLDFADQTAKTYWKTGVSVAAGPALVYTCLFFLVKRYSKPLSHKWLSLALVGFIGGSFLTVRSAASHTRAFPRFIQPLFVGGMYLKASPYVGPREKPYFVPVNKPVAKHIIFLMDESVRGDFLGVNGYKIDTTPFLSNNRHRFFDYGVASSFSNSSSSSNYSVITGMRMAGFPDRKQRSRRMPFIWEYAKLSMQKVVFLWAQTSFFPQKQKFDFDNSIEAIDMYGVYPNIPVYEYDRRVIDVLDKITSEEKSSFVWVNKWGSHFDYDSGYPEAQTKFKPIYRHSNPDDRDALLNSYYNSLSWGVDQFFFELLERLKGRDIIIIYSADHGQSILEDGIPGTHNRTYNVSSSQASVPMLAFGFNESTINFLKQNYKPENKDRVAAEQVFPTLLYLMGYSLDDIRKHYPPTLFDLIPERSRTFLSGDMWGLGPSVNNKFDPQTLVQ